MLRCPNCGEEVKSDEDVDFLLMLASDIMQDNITRLGEGMSPPRYNPKFAERLSEIAKRLEGEN